jgi:hypothetical protein
VPLTLEARFLALVAAEWQTVTEQHQQIGQTQIYERLRPTPSKSDKSGKDDGDKRQEAGFSPLKVRLP